jgi:hypothetical protein
MRFLVLTIPAVMVLLAACDAAPAPAPAGGTPAGTPPAAPTPKPGDPPVGKKPATPAVPVKREMPKKPPLTEEVARRVLRGQMDRLAGDDASRQALLYLADLGDRTVVNAFHEKLLKIQDGRFEDVRSAAVGAEASLAFGEPGAAATALKVAKQYEEEEEDPDDMLLHALARVDGPERAEATAILVKVAGNYVEDQVAPLAIEILAKNATKEARELFLTVARDPEAEARARGAAVAGLLRIADPEAKAVADKLVAEAANPDSPEGVAPEDVVAGLGVEGAVEAVPYIQKLMDAAVSSDAAGAVWVGDETSTALVRIHAKGGGAALVGWLKEIAKKNEAEFEEAASYTLWAFGDAPSAAIVAKTLEGSVAAWNATTDMEPAVVILDTAARLGGAAAPPLRPIVDSAAQIDPASGAKGNYDALLSLNLAAAHAFLKSGGK